VLAFGVGWAAALYVEAGAPIADEEDAYQRYQYALTNDDTLERLETLLKLTRQLTPETLPGAARAYEEDLWPLANSDIRILMAYWAEQDPRGMVSAVSGWSNLRVQQISVTEALGAIAKNEGYPAAREFYDALPSHARQTGRIMIVLAFIDHGELDDMAGFITSYADHGDRDQVAEVAVERMIDNLGPVAVQEWVESLPPGRGNSSDVKRVAFRAAQRAHMDNGYREEFEGWLGRVGNEPWALGGWRAIGVHWAKVDPLAAIEWARSLPEDVGRLAVVQETIRVYAGRDSDGALPWILAQEPDLELDRGTGLLVKQFQAGDPEQALELFGRIVGKTTFQNVHRTLTAYCQRLPEKRGGPLLEQIKEISQARLRRARSESPVSPQGG
jgi:hypothetical protein